MSKKVDVELFGETFNYDAKTDCLIHKEKSRFKVPFSKLMDRGTHYEAPYYPEFERTGYLKGIEADSGLCRVNQRVDLDPEGMAEKYGIKVSDLKGKTDFDVMVNQDFYNARVTERRWPTIDIAGDPFWVNVRAGVISQKDVEL